MLDLEQQAKMTGVISRRIADNLRELILMGEVDAGSRLRQEDLAAQFGASRIPIREALKQLESEGLVILVPNSGAWVAKFNLRECVEAYKIREVIDPLAIRESVKAMTDSDVDKLDGLARQIETAESSREFLALDREFHLLSYQAANMPNLIAIVERFWNTTQHYRRAFVDAVGSEGRRIIHAEHRMLVESFRRRDEVAAHDILYHHIRRTRLQLQQRTELFE